MSREDWLLSAFDTLANHFPGCSYLGRRYRVSVGYPSRPGRTRVRLFDVVPDVSGDRQVFISPLISDPVEVLAVMLYALVQDDPAGTRNANRRLAEIGFDRVARNPHAVLPDATLTETLAEMAATLGPYEHTYTEPDSAAAARPQTTRMLKLVCDSGHEPYIVRASQRTIDRGLPGCGACGDPMRLA